MKQAAVTAWLMVTVACAIGASALFVGCESSSDLLVITVGEGGVGGVAGSGGVTGESGGGDANAGGSGGETGGSGGASGEAGGAAGSGGTAGGSGGASGGAGGSGGIQQPSCPEGFVAIKPGTFMMGSPQGEPCRYPDERQHNVTLTRGFCMSETQVTQGQYQALMGENPSHFATCGNNCPVEQVTWHKAAEYCNKLSDKEGLEKCYEQSGNEYKPIAGSPYQCKGYRLPTEAEWEYAARAGTTTAFYNGNITGCNSANQYDCRQDLKLDKIGWYCKNSSSKTHPVKGKVPNAWKLYDMSGNVWEWCHDWYVRGLGTAAVTDPYGPDTPPKPPPDYPGDSRRVFRGGCWESSPAHCRSAIRNHEVPTYSGSVGIRPVRSL